MVPSRPVTNTAQWDGSGGRVLFVPVSGARGMGEMPYLPLVPAVTAGVREAVGVWFDAFPLTGERVLDGLEAGSLPLDGA